VGHLVSHSSGIDAGDLFVATEGDDEIESYGRLIDGAGALFEPGVLFSYNNAGFVLAGMVVQRLRDETFEDVARSRVFTPLGMASSDFVAGGELVARGAFDPSGDPPYAIGHLALPGELVRVIDDPVCSRSLAPAGGTFVSTATDLVRFAASHLAAAATGPADLPPVVSPASAALMRDLHARAPGGVTKMAGVGLGWQIWRHGERMIARIGGANPGQSGLVAVDPAAGTALAALTNSDQGVNLVTGLLDGFGPAAVKDDDDPPDDLSVYCGTYGSHAMAFAVDLDGGALGVQLVEAADLRIGATQMSTVSSAFGHTDLEAIAKMRFPLTAIDRTTFSSPMGPIAFVRESPSDERPRWMRWRMRVLRRR
jgi:CubicO group peptidase (beta-lactamase class C family)